MTDIKVDIAIIGTGTAGMAAYRQASHYTDSIALIEGDSYGTTCARVGCMPSKLLIAASEARHRTEALHEFGMLSQKLDVDGQKVMQRVRSERDRFVGFVLDSVASFKPEHLFKVKAQFLDDHHLALSDSRTLAAQRIVIATGSKPQIPEVLLGAGKRLITNDDIFEWQDLPASVVVIGSGVIGLELGQALHRLGVRVTLLARSDSIGGLTDPHLKAYAHQTFDQELDYHRDVVIDQVTQQDEQVMVQYHAQKGTACKARFDYLLAATGRMPRVDGLGLENTSLVLNKQGVPLYHPHSMQCGDSSIFIAGDVVGVLLILHEAADEGRIAGDNAGRYPNVRKRQRKTPMSVVFCEPQIAMIGETYQALKSKLVDFSIGEVSFENQGRSRVMLVNQGLLRLYGDKATAQLLGAEMLGPAAEHLAHLLAWCVQLEMSVDDILQLPFYHPVIEEGLRTALRDLYQNLSGKSHPMPAELQEV